MSNYYLVVADLKVKTRFWEERREREDEKISGGDQGRRTKKTRK